MAYPAPTTPYAQGGQRILAIRACKLTKVLERVKGSRFSHWISCGVGMEGADGGTDRGAHTTPPTDLDTRRGKGKREDQLLLRDEPETTPSPPDSAREHRRESARGLGGTQMDYDDDYESDEPIPDWVFSLLWWPVSILGFVLRVIGRFSKLAFLLSVSAATYYWIYSAMVPPSLSEHHPINFQYPLLHSERASGVSANATVDFAFQRQLMLRSGARGMDWASGMAPGSSLDVGVSLELPECQANYDVGTFAINVVVYDKQGQAVGQGARSLVLRHKSSLLKHITTLVFSVPLVMSLTSEHQVVSGTAVQLVSLPKGGLHSASVSLSDARLQVYSASVHITFVLTGFRYYMFHWFFTSMAIGTVIISNLYVSAIGWLSQRIFGASFDVDEELGGARKHQRARAKGSRRAGARGGARRRRAHRHAAGAREHSTSGASEEGARSGLGRRSAAEGEEFSNSSDEWSDDSMGRPSEWDDPDADWRTPGSTNPTAVVGDGDGPRPSGGVRADQGVARPARKGRGGDTVHPDSGNDASDPVVVVPGSGRDSEGGGRAGDLAGEASGSVRGGGSPSAQGRVSEGGVRRRHQAASSAGPDAKASADAGEV